MLLLSELLVCPGVWARPFTELKIEQDAHYAPGTVVSIIGPLSSNSHNHSKQTRDELSLASSIFQVRIIFRNTK